MTMMMMMMMIIMDNKLLFPKAELEPKLFTLQKDVVEFVTSVILKHEREFYHLVVSHCNSKFEDILGTTSNTIVEMITTTTSKFYNDIYRTIQNKVYSDLSNVVLSMGNNCNYGPHILLYKLLHLTLDVHLDINREQIECNKNFDIYEKSVLNQINVHLISINIIKYMITDVDDDIPFLNIPDGNSAFTVKINE